MNIFMNARFEPSVTMAFENGWTLNISQTINNRYKEIAILPTWIAENLYTLPHKELMQLCDRDDMIARGDYIEKFKVNDDGMVDMIVAVASRPTEKRLEKTRQDILKAARA